MTRLKIGDEVFDLTAAAAEATLGDLRELARVTAVPGPKVTPRTMHETFVNAGIRLQTDQAAGFLDLFDDDDFLANLQGLVWLARRNRGETLTYEEAGRFAFHEGDLLGDEEVDAPPKARGGRVSRQPSARTASGFSDVEADVREWLPAIQLHLPGAGLTAFNIWTLEYSWWIEYRAVVDALVQAIKKRQNTKPRARAGRRG